MKSLIKRNIIALLLLVLVPYIIINYLDDNGLVASSVLIYVVAVLMVVAGFYLIVMSGRCFKSHKTYQKVVPIVFILLGLGLVVYAVYSAIAFSLLSNFTGL